jgi:drug/metabolite transporter (DMT)-like permease
MAAYGLVLFALSQGAMAHVSALRETSVLFAAAIGTLLLKEPFGRVRVAAAAAIVAGVVTMQTLG